jgi:hypothetical protein
MGMGDGDQEVRETNVLERMLRDRSKVAKP